MFQAKSSSSIANLDIHFNPESWGPISGEKLPIFEGVPYAHFDKKDKVGRPADFVSQNTQVNYQRRHYSSNATDFTYRHDAAEDSTFQLVDTAKSSTRNRSGVKRQVTKPQARTNNNRTPGGYTAQGGRNQGNNQGNGMNQSGGGQGGNNKRFTNRNNNYNNPNNRFGNRRRADRDPSLTVEADWICLEEFDLAQLGKLAAQPPAPGAVKDLVKCGHIDQYDETYEKLTTRSAPKLRRIENKLFYYVTSTDDPILGKFAVEGVGNIFATDAIVSQLMAAQKSVFPWDVVVQKVNGLIFLDKREESNFDLLTVSETAADPPNPNDEHLEEYNHPEKLAMEASMINQNFTQQVLLPSEMNDERRKAFEPNPFFDDNQSGLEPASIAYRYRLFPLGAEMKLVIRTELHGWVEKKTGDQMMTCFALNEWDARYSGGINWRQKIDGQRGSVLATEMKNNNNKLAKWTIQSLLADADVMKLGYVSRLAPSQPSEHQILATQFLKPKELVQQLGMRVENIWGVMKMFCDKLLKKEDGKYLIMKDPNKPVVRLYSVPLSAFENGGDEEEDDDDEDEDGEGARATGGAEADGEEEEAGAKTATATA